MKAGKQITRGDNAIDTIVRQVVKNKLSPPFSHGTHEPYVRQGDSRHHRRSRSRHRYRANQKKGSWLAYKGETLGQGKETVAAYLDQHPELLKEIKDAILSADTTELEYDMSPEDNAATAIPDAGEEEDNILLDDEE